MSLNGILRRASSFLGITGGDSSKQMYEDGDIVFCEFGVSFIVLDLVFLFKCESL